MKRFLCTVLVCFLVLYAGQARAQMTSGTVTNGSIIAGGQSIQTFTGTSGQYVSLNVSAASYTGHIQVINPDTTTMTSGYNRVAGTLSQTGTFQVVITGTFPTDHGSYSLYYVRGSSSVSGGSLTSGGTIADTLPVNGLMSYQFTGTAGQGVVLHAAFANDMVIEVYKPDGSYWNYGDSAFLGTLPSTGTYTVVLEGQYPSYSGAYKLYYVKGEAGVSSGAVTSGLAVSDTLPLNGLMSYTFTGSAGQGILIAVNSSYNAFISVFNPDGSPITPITSRYSGTLAQNGIYTVVVSGQYTTYSGPYTLYYVRGSDQVSDGTLVSTRPHPGTLAANGLNSYQFAGTSGNSLSVTSTASYARWLEVYNPDGSYLTSSNSGSLSSASLPATGQYTLVFYGFYASYTGAYSITLTTTPPTVTASDNTKVVCIECAMRKAGAAAAVQPTNAAGNPIDLNVGYEDQAIIAQAVNSFGPPINSDVGYQQQAETDYRAGGLVFSRVYRSDSTWTNNTIGTYWRHSYARTLSITGGSAASVTDGTGATTKFTLSGSTWVANDPSTTSTLAAITGGYAYTLADGTVEKYNSSYQFTRIEYFGGGAVNLAYNGSGQLTSVTNENGRQLTFTYDGSGRVSTAPSPMPMTPIATCRRSRGRIRRSGPISIRMRPTSTRSPASRTRTATVSQPSATTPAAGAP